MPIYEYFCPACNARFSRLTRTFDAPSPPCPGCGNTAPEKLVSAAYRGRPESAQRVEIESRAQEVNRNDPQAMARFLKAQSGEVLEEVNPMERAAFQEILDRRAQGATDAELQDVVDTLPLGQPPQAGAHAHAHIHDATCACEHTEADTHHRHTHGARRKARNLGWG